MASPKSAYQRGEQDVSEQLSTFHLVMGITKWGSLVIGSFLLFITLWFCTPAGFLGGLIPALILVALGVTFLRSKPDAGH